MTDEFSLTLSWFAGYSNFYSVLSVLVCFCIMVVFILRLNGEHFLSSPATHYNIPKEQPMTKLYNPFSVQISEGKGTSLKDGLYLDISIKTSSQIEIFWGVNIQTFQREIHKPVTDIYRRLKDKETYDGNHLNRVNLGIIEVTERPCEVFSKTPETVTESSLGSPPRQLYPVVVLAVCEDLHMSGETSTVVAQFTIIHLKDSMCPLDSHIVYQFVKTNRNNLLSLQPIFLSSSEQDFSDPNTTHSNESSNDDTTSCATDTCDNCGQEKDSENERNECGTWCSCKTNNDVSNCAEGKSKQISERNSANVDNEETDNVNMQDAVDPDIGCSKNGNENHGNRDVRGTLNSDIDLDEDELDIDAGIGDIENVDIGLDETNTCIICQSAVIYYTLLPCRHACVCISCVRLVERCPMCRSFIDAFFRLYERDGNEDDSFVDTEPHNDVHIQAATVWEAINHRLNEMLGFA